MNKKEKQYSCPKCGCEDTVRHGFNLTVKEGSRQRRKCKKCAHTFYESVGGK